MGWSGGSSLMKVIIKQVKECVPSAVLRVRIYQPIVEAFDAQDWDTYAECLGEDVAFDEVIVESHPELLDDEYNDLEDDEDLDDIDDEDELEHDEDLDEEED